VPKKMQGEITTRRRGNPRPNNTERRADRFQSHSNSKAKKKKKRKREHAGKRTPVPVPLQTNRQTQLKRDSAITNSGGGNREETWFKSTDRRDDFVKRNVNPKKRGTGKSPGEQRRKTKLGGGGAQESGKAT